MALREEYLTLGKGQSSICIPQALGYGVEANTILGKIKNFRIAAYHKGVIGRTPRRPNRMINN